MTQHLGSRFYLQLHFPTFHSLPSVLVNYLYWHPVLWASQPLWFCQHHSQCWESLHPPPFFFFLPALNPVYLFLPNHWEPQLMVPCLILMCCLFSLLNVRIFPPQAKDKFSLLEVFWHKEPCDIHSSFLCLYRIKYLENLSLYSGHIVGSHTV